MESAFGTDFSSVRLHQGDEAEKLAAQAYTQGTDIHFAPGQYDPQSQAGQELLGHELTHVVQQAQGRVSTSIHAKGVPVNDDPALESEADALGAKAARGDSVAADVGAAPVIRAGAPVKAKKDSAGGGETPAGEFMVSTEEAAENPAQAKGLAAPVQASGLGPVQRQTKKKSFVPHQVTITKQMTVAEFRAVAMMQIFGGNAPKVEWHNTMKTFDPGTYQVDVESSLLKRGRSEVAKSKGISVGEDASWSPAIR